MVGAGMWMAIPSAAQALPAEQKFHGSHDAMGTVFELDLYASDAARAGELMELAFEEIDRLEALLSNYRASSELSRIDREVARGPVSTDPETFGFMERALFWSRQSDGAFDITVGPLLRTWGFFAHQGKVPSEAQLAKARSEVGWRNLTLEPRTRGVGWPRNKPLDLDPGSIGKGFAVDSVVQLLRSEGVTSAFISAGASTLYGLGAPPGRDGWPVTIADPRAAAAGSTGPASSAMHSATILLRDLSLSTGACNQKFFLEDGHRYCHIFDPRSGRPVEGMLQTSVIDPSATDSDALSTVVFVLQPEESRRLLATLPRTRAVLYGEAADTSSCVAIHWQGDICAVRH